MSNTYRFQVIFLEFLLRFIVAIIGTTLYARRNQQFFDLMGRFEHFDKFTLRVKCKENPMNQLFYLLYVASIGICNFVFTICYTEVNVFILIVWNVFFMLTMLTVVQYMTYISMLRRRYEISNTIFTNSTYFDRPYFIVKVELNRFNVMIKKV